MKKQLLLVLTLCLGFLSMPSYAESLKIGIVNINELMQSSPQRVQMVEELKKEFKTRKEEITKLNKSILGLEEKFKRDKEVLSLAEKEKLKNNIIAKQKQLKRKSDAFAEDVSIREREQAQKLLEVVGDVVDEIARKEQYDFVMRREAAPFFVSDKVDMTAKVLAKLKTMKGE